MSRWPVLSRWQFGVALAVLAAGTPLVRAQDDPVSRRAAIEGMYPIMMHALESKNFGRARNICDQAILWEPRNPVHHYNLGCIEAQAGGARLPYAMGELELAVALGFNDAAHLQADPDLRPLRDDPRFARLVRQIANNAHAGSAIAALAIPAPGAKRTAVKPPEPAPGVLEKPAPAAFQKGVPVGLYFMTRYWAFTRTLEKAAWYFAPEGTVYQNLEHGFSRADLGAHAGPKGTAKATGAQLEISWQAGSKSISDVEHDGAGFMWDMGIFTPVEAFQDSGEVAGIYEGGESLSIGGDRAAVSKRLELNRDGTFAWEGVSFVGAAGKAGRLSAGSSGTSEGQWELAGYSLILTEKNGVVLRRIAFPDDDDKTPVKPDRMFFGGTLYKRQP